MPTPFGGLASRLFSPTMGYQKPTLLLWAHAAPEGIERQAHRMDRSSATFGVTSVRIQKI